MKNSFKDFLNKLRDKTQSMMIGRYGTDDFSRFLMILALVLLVLSMMTHLGVLYFAAIAALIYSYYRVFSKDFPKRAEENRKYREKSAEVRKSFRILKKRFSDRKEYKYFKCPSCGQEVRVPKGKGHIRITCPKCRTQFDRTV